MKILFVKLGWLFYEKMDEACDNFRSYFQSNGISEALTSIFTKLSRMRRRPENSIEFVRQNLPPAQEDTIARLTNELQELEKDIVGIRKRLPVKKIPEPAIEEDDEHSDLDNDELIGIEKTEFNNQKLNEFEQSITVAVEPAHEKVVQNEMIMINAKQMEEDTFEVRAEIKNEEINIRSTEDESQKLSDRIESETEDHNKQSIE